MIFLLNSLRDVEQESESTPELDFAHSFAGFLSKWELARMVTWDLPYPQQPMHGVSLEEVETLAGPHVMVDYYPTYLAPDSDEELSAQIRARQSTIAKIAGTSHHHPLGRLGPHGTSPSQWETVFRMWFIESTVRTRYGTRRGIVARLSEAFESMFGVSSDTIKKYRRQYGRLICA